MSNRLSTERSPYLLQHAENPVDWRPWGPEVFEEAKRTDKPVLLSIGYSTCHWCHVMAHESFEDETVAQAVNAAFLPVKVDREERPDVDAVYMAACLAMNGSGGWPLTVLLTPDQKPFWAGTYLPKDQLLHLLRKAARLWREDRAGVLVTGDTLTAHLQQEGQARPGTPSRELVRQAVSQFAQSYDERWGGFGAAPKFPTPHNLIFLLRYAQLAKEEHAREMALHTLNNMYRGGLFDHVGGGFSRYSTDQHWLVPHFEKMLYDNALLALAYTEAFQHTRCPIYGKITRRTLDYVLRELSGPQGGFCCGQDADSDGVEGKYYALTPDELAQALGGVDGLRFCQWYGITPEGNFEGKSIPNLLGQSQFDQDPEDMAALREQMYAYRLSRTALHRDDKVLTAWNGLAMAALARAGLVLDEPWYLDAARQTLTDILVNYHGYKGIAVILVFDAYKVKGGVEKVEETGGIHVVYTREKETADMYIERVTYDMAKKHRVRVASSDNLEQMIILGHDAVSVSADEFRLEVEEVNRRIRQILDRQQSRTGSGQRLQIPLPEEDDEDQKP